ncbi:MAG TPA: hypothetical protein VFR49_08660 [Solirubrobacteraceae bacterium]|nr:hypothetical protein [Solirubrobacteraceae bacterium]
MGKSFALDIAPILAPYRDNMLWRFDLADYGAVKANATLIFANISPTDGSQMPPPPLPPLHPSDVAAFRAWIADACPP